MKLTFVFILIFLFSANAYAYIDPGTGTFLLQAILAFITSCIAAILMTWKKFKFFLDKLFKKKSKSENDKIS